MTAGGSRCIVAPLAGRSRLVGDPVDVSTGTVYDHETDFRVQRDWGTFEWIRYFDGGAVQHDRGLGRGMRHALDYSLRFDLDGLSLSTPMGPDIAFSFLPTNGQRCASEGTFLERVSDDDYRVEAGVGATLQFRFHASRRAALLVAATIGGVTVGIEHDRDRKIVGLTFRDASTLRLTWCHGHLAEVHFHSDGERPHKLASYRYDERQRMTKVVDAYGHALGLEYDEVNRLVRKTDRVGYSFLYEYDTEGRCRQSSGEDGAELVRFDYMPLERTTRVTRADGGTTDYFYDAQGTVLAVVDAFGGSERYITDDDGRVVTEVDPLGNATRVVYDPSGRAVAKVDPRGHVKVLPEAPGTPDPRDHWVGECSYEWTYGRKLLPSALPVTGETLWRVPADLRGAIATSASEWRGRPRMVRTLQGLPVREEREEGSSRRYAFDGNANVRWMIDFDGSRTDYEYVSDNHLAVKRDALGRVQRLEHSPYKKLTAFVDAGGTRSEYAYDRADRLTEVHRHGRLRERYLYDRGGQLVEKQNTRGQPLFRASYGRAGLEQSRTWLDGEAQRFAYDSSGRLITAEGEAGKCTFAYTDSGHRREDLREGLGVEHEIVGAQLRCTTALARFVTCHRRIDEDTAEIVDPAGGRYVLRRLAEGVFAHESPSGTTEVSQYDVFGRCLLRSVRSTATGRARSERTFKYSGEGDLLAVQDARRGVTFVEQDAAHRLRAIRHPDGTVERYVYDEADNLLSMPGLSEWPTAADFPPRVDRPLDSPVSLDTGNRLHRANGERFHYDERDHVIAREGERVTIYYLRDAADQLRRVVRDDEVLLEASYDPLGRRTSKKVESGTWHYYWDTDRLAAELFPDGRLRIYVYADLDALVPLGFVEYDSRDAAPESGRSYTFATNHLGTVECVYGPEGTTAWSARVSPYGGAAVEVGLAFHQPLRMVGHYRDDETGLHYNRFRYYDPSVGRYIESDPLGIEGGSNVYAYTENPLREVDVRGLTGDCPNGVDCPHNPNCPRARPDTEGTDLPRPRPSADELAGVRDRLAGLAQDAWSRMRAAHADEERRVTLPDGTRLRVADGDVPGGRGPCLSLVMDMQTGQVFYGQNTGRAPIGLREPLGSRTTAVAAANQSASPAPTNYPAGWSRRAGIPGSHSEVQAANQALAARPGARMEDLAIYNVRTEDMSLARAPEMPRCTNCAPITDGAHALTD